LSDWPLPQPSRWLETVNLPQSQAEEKMVRDAIARGRPVGSDHWPQRIARSLGLDTVKGDITDSKSVMSCVKPAFKSVKP
jgi:hypothetical protein